MKRTRAVIIRDIKKRKDKIQNLYEEIYELQKEDYLLSDKKQWFTEVEVDKVISKRPKITEKRLVGRIHWNELFYDSDYPNDPKKGVWVERSEVVRINGKWL